MTLSNTLASALAESKNAAIDKMNRSGRNFDLPSRLKAGQLVVDQDKKTNREACEDMGVSKSTLESWKAGKLGPSAATES